MSYIQAFFCILHELGDFTNAAEKNTNQQLFSPRGFDNLWEGRRNLDAAFRSPKAK